MERLIKDFALIAPVLLMMLLGMFDMSYNMYANSMLHGAVVEWNLSLHELMITLFLFLTAPVTALFIAKVHIHRHETKASLPKAGADGIWATHDVTEPETESKADPAQG